MGGWLSDVVQLFLQANGSVRFPSAQWAVGPGSYNPKPVEKSAYFSQPPFWSSAKRFDRKSYRLFTGNEVSERTGQ